MEKEQFIKYLETPIGWLEIKSTDKVLLAILFVEKPGVESVNQPKILAQTNTQLQEYFNGTRKTFDLSIEPEGSDFQKKVWKFVQTISFGETASYLDIAVLTGSEKNTRAVGMANGKNPIPIIIPCHRIIGSNGKLTGYAGGLERKRWLLQHEFNHTVNKDKLF